MQYQSPFTDGRLNGRKGCALAVTAEVYRLREAWAIKDLAYMMLLLTARQHAGESRPCMFRLAGCV